MGDLEYRDQIWQKMASLGKKMDNLEAKLSSLESEDKELMKRVEDLEKICQYQHALITISLPVRLETQLPMVYEAGLMSAMEGDGKAALEEMIRNWKKRSLNQKK